MGGVAGILAKALEGGSRGTTGGILSAHGWRGPATKHEESGKSVEEQASGLVGRDQPISEDNTGLTDKNDDILRKQLKSYNIKKAHEVIQLGFNLNKLAKVDGNSFYLKLQELFEDKFPGISLDSQNAVAEENDRYQDEGPVPRSGIVQHPEQFFGGGWSEAGPTTVQGAATLHDNGPGPGADDMANYRDEQAAKDVSRKTKIKNKVAALLKLAFSPPTEGMDIDNSLPDHEDPDFRRMTSVPRATEYERTTRQKNKVRKGSVKSAQSMLPSNNVVQDFSKRMRQSMQNVGGKPKKPPKTPEINDVRKKTLSNPGKVPAGYAEMDSKVPDSPSGTDSKVASLLKRCLK